MRRLLLAGVLALALTGAAYAFLVRDSTVQPRVLPAKATATIGSGEDAVAVGPRGRVLAWLQLPAEVRLPQLPISEVPRGGRLAGPVLEQARVLGAAPAALRPYIESSYQGDSGVNVVLRSGIELRFGDATRVGEKWRAAAAILADPSLEAVDYVNLHAPGRPAVYGSGHTLPPVP